MFHRFQNLLYGRNGNDQLSTATSLTACVLLVIAMFVNGSIAGSILWFLAFVFLLITYFRIFSRNLPKRQAENAKFLSLLAPVTRRINLAKTKHAQKHLYRFFKCPGCDTVLRVPVGKGRVRITCKNCGHVFEKTT